MLIIITSVTPSISGLYLVQEERKWIECPEYEDVEYTIDVELITPQIEIGFKNKIHKLICFNNCLVEFEN